MGKEHHNHRRSFLLGWWLWEKQSHGKKTTPPPHFLARCKCVFMNPYGIWMLEQKMKVMLWIYDGWTGWDVCLMGKFRVVFVKAGIRVDFQFAYIFRMEFWIRFKRKENWSYLTCWQTLYLYPRGLPVHNIHELVVSRCQRGCTLCRFGTLFHQVKMHLPKYRQCHRKPKQRKIYP